MTGIQIKKRIEVLEAKNKAVKDKTKVTCIVCNKEINLKYCFTVLVDVTSELRYYFCSHKCFNNRGLVNAKT